MFKVEEMVNGRWYFMKAFPSRAAAEEYARDCERMLSIKVRVR